MASRPGESASQDSRPSTSGTRPLESSVSWLNLTQPTHKELNDLRRYDYQVEQTFRGVPVKWEAEVHGPKETFIYPSLQYESELEQTTTMGTATAAALLDTEESDEEDETGAGSDASDSPEDPEAADAAVKDGVGALLTGGDGHVDMNAGDDGQEETKKKASGSGNDANDNMGEAGSDGNGHPGGPSGGSCPPHSLARGGTATGTGGRLGPDRRRSTTGAVRPQTAPVWRITAPQDVLNKPPPEAESKEEKGFPKGERFLQNQLIRAHHQRVLARERAKKQEAVLVRRYGFQALKQGRRNKQMVHNALNAFAKGGKMDQNPESLYSGLVSNARSRLLQAMKHVNQLSKEEIAEMTVKSELNLPRGMRHLEDAIVYYRTQGKLKVEQVEQTHEQAEKERKRMALQSATAKALEIQAANEVSLRVVEHTRTRPGLDGVGASRRVFRPEENQQVVPSNGATSMDTVSWLNTGQWLSEKRREVTGSGDDDISLDTSTSTFTRASDRSGGPVVNKRAVHDRASFFQRIGNATNVISQGYVDSETGLEAARIRGTESYGVPNTMERQVHMAHQMEADSDDAVMPHRQSLQASVEKATSTTAKQYEAEHHAELDAPQLQKALSQASASSRTGGKVEAARQLAQLALAQSGDGETPQGASAKAGPGAGAARLRADSTSSVEAAARPRLRTASDASTGSIRVPTPTVSGSQLGIAHTPAALSLPQTRSLVEQAQENTPPSVVAKNANQALKRLSVSADTTTQAEYLRTAVIANGEQRRRSASPGSEAAAKRQPSPNAMTGGDGQSIVSEVSLANSATRYGSPEGEINILRSRSGSVHTARGPGRGSMRSGDTAPGSVSPPPAIVMLTDAHLIPDGARAPSVDNSSIDASEAAPPSNAKGVAFSRLLEQVERGGDSAAVPPGGDGQQQQQQHPGITGGNGSPSNQPAGDHGEDGEQGDTKAQSRPATTVSQRRREAARKRAEMRLRMQEEAERRKPQKTIQTKPPMGRIQAALDKAAREEEARQTQQESGDAGIAATADHGSDAGGSAASTAHQFKVITARPSGAPHVSSVNAARERQSKALMEYGVIQPMDVQAMALTGDPHRDQAMAHQVMRQAGFSEDDIHQASMMGFGVSGFAAHMPGSPTGLDANSVVSSLSAVKDTSVQALRTPMERVRMQAARAGHPISGDASAASSLALHDGSDLGESAAVGAFDSSASGGVAGGKAPGAGDAHKHDPIDPEQYLKQMFGPNPADTVGLQGRGLWDRRNQTGHENAEKVGLATAQNRFLYTCLTRGALPEPLLAYRETVHQIDLGHYGLGNELALAIASGLWALHEDLHSLKLAHNRLTHVSIVPILDRIDTEILLELDLTGNVLHGRGAAALGELFNKHPVLHTLRVNSCGLRDADVRHIIEPMLNHGTDVETLEMTHNEIGSNGGSWLARLLTLPTCKLEELLLSWNAVAKAGAVSLADGLEKNYTLRRLLLADNAIGDEGAQNIARSLRVNTSLTELDLARNNVGGKACFVFSLALQEQSEMRALNLSGNTLGEAGGRALFRAILQHDIKCLIVLRHCLFPADSETLFDRSNAAARSPYDLDMTKPYDAALLNELCVLLRRQSEGCEINELTWSPPVVRKGRVSDGGGRISGGAANRPVTAPGGVGTGGDGGSGGRGKGRGGGGGGGRNIRRYQLEVDGDGDIYDAVANEPWELPRTGRVRVALSQTPALPGRGMEVSQHMLETMTRIIVEAQTESDRRNWVILLTKDNFFVTAQAQFVLNVLHRADLLGGGELSVIDVICAFWNRLLDHENKHAFLCHNLPDRKERYELASTMSFEAFRMNVANMTGHYRLNMAMSSHAEVFRVIGALANSERHESRITSRRSDTSQNGDWLNFRNSTLNKVPTKIDQAMINTPPVRGVLEFDYVSTARPPNDAEPAERADFEYLMRHIGLSFRERFSRASGTFALLELQHAAARCYFTGAQMHTIMDCFPDTEDMQAKVIIALFSRMLDLENFDVVMRNVSRETFMDVGHRLGWLNMLNPLKPALHYALNLRYNDDRRLCKLILDLAASEPGDSLTDASDTEFPLIELYAILGRIVDEPHDAVARFSYAEIGERGTRPVWPNRVNILTYFLIGTQPIADRVMEVVDHCKELEEANKLSVGPIDLQYRNFVRRRHRTSLEQAHDAAKKLKRLASLAERIHMQSGSWDTDDSPTGDKASLSKQEEKELAILQRANSATGRMVG